MPAEFDLSGRTAVVTGASRGIGKSIAKALAAAGARVALVGRDADALDAAAAEAGRERSVIHMCDVSDSAAVDALADRVLEDFGRCDILVNNAGINIRKALQDFTFVEWQKVISTNLFGPMLCSKAFIPGMVKNAFGRIINIASTMASVALPGRSAYCASKAGLVAMTRALALELAAYGITANCISPGPFATELNKPLLEDPVKNAEFLSKIPLGRWGRVEEIGGLAVFLASDSASFITGSDLLIDGGWTAQ